MVGDARRRCRHYWILAEQVRDAFCAEYVSSSGLIRSDCQTRVCAGPALAPRPRRTDTYSHGISPRRTRAAAEVHRGNRLLGTAVILDALCASGHRDAAYRMLLTHEFPSWLHAVDLGATTIWERWDSMLSGRQRERRGDDRRSTTMRSVRSPTGCTVRSQGFSRPRPAIGNCVWHRRWGAASLPAALRHLSPYGEIAIEWHLLARASASRRGSPSVSPRRSCCPTAPRYPTSPHGEHRFELARLVTDAAIDGDRTDVSAASEAMRSR